VFKPSHQWICCQIGAREHYAIPRSLHQQGNLSHLITDAWITPHSPLNYLPKKLLTSLRDRVAEAVGHATGTALPNRFHRDLAQASTHAFTNSLIQLEIQQGLQNVRGWVLGVPSDKIAVISLAYQVPTASFKAKTTTYLGWVSSLVAAPISILTSKLTLILIFSKLYELF